MAFNIGTQGSDLAYFLEVIRDPLAAMVLALVFVSGIGVILLGIATVIVLAVRGATKAFKGR